MAVDLATNLVQADKCFWENIGLSGSHELPRDELPLLDPSGRCDARRDLRGKGHRNAWIVRGRISTDSPRRDDRLGAGKRPLRIRCSSAPIQLSGVALDITGRKLEEDRRQRLLESECAAREDAERTSRIKDEFLATLSHELRTPLTAIHGWCDILRRHRNEEDLAQGLDVIHRNTQIQAKIIEDLLDMSRIVSGKIRLDVREMDPALSIGEAIETVRPAAEAKCVALCIATSTSPPRSLPTRNACNRFVEFAFQRDQIHASRGPGRFAGETEPRLVADRSPRFGRRHIVRFSSLCLRSLSPGRRLDDCAGIRGWVWDWPSCATWSNCTAGRFGPKVREAGGAPPSSSISRCCATESDVQQSAANGPGAASAGTARPDAGRLTGVRILVVDDEPDVSELVRRLLEHKGATVTSVRSASAAMLEIEREHPDVLVSDIGMPEHDGV